MSEYLSVDFEGGDQVGKGDAVRNLSLELASEGLNVTVVSFPCYATPVGFSVRKVLKEDLLSKYDMSLKDATTAKMALFSLNRLEVLNSILSSEKSDIYLFDRGPFSNALTIAYAISTGLSPEYKEELASKALSLDSYFRESLDIDKCVVRLCNTGCTWSKEREEDTDLHESRDVQEISDSIYTIFANRLGESWIDISSKNENGWRNREEITKESLEFVKKRHSLSPVGDCKQPNYFPLALTLSNLYRGSTVDSRALDLFMSSIGSNNKQLMYEISEVISKQVVNSAKDITWYNSEIERSVRDMFDDIPELLFLLEELYGEDFVIKFLRSVEK